MIRILLLHEENMVICAGQVLLTLWNTGRRDGLNVYFQLEDDVQIIARWTLFHNEGTSGMWQRFRVTKLSDEPAISVFQGKMVTFLPCR